MSKNTAPIKSKPAQASGSEKSFAFDKQNYLLMIAGIVVIILGFILMYGKEDIFSSTKITLAPLVVLAGFSLEIYAIMKKPKH